MRGPLIGGKDFQLPLDKERKRDEGSWRGTKEEEKILCFGGENKGEKWKCEKEISS
jgi:hypothetical protein